MADRAEAAELAKTVGWSMQAGFTASKALWLKRNEPDAFDATATMALPHDFVNFKLTGALATDAGDASGTYECPAGLMARRRAALERSPSSGRPVAIAHDGSRCPVLPCATCATGRGSLQRPRLTHVVLPTYYDAGVQVQRLLP